MSQISIGFDGYDPRQDRPLLLLNANAEAQQRGMLPGDQDFLPQISDLSGYGHHELQPTPGLQPLLIHNGLSWVFRATGVEYMIGVPFAQTFLGHVSVMLGSLPLATEAPAERPLLSMAAQAVGNQYWSVGLHQGRMSIRARHGVSDTQDISRDEDLILPPNERHVLNYESSGTLYRMWRNNVAVTNITNITGANEGDWTADIVSPVNHSLFTRITNVVGEKFIGDLVFLHVYGRVLDDVVRARVNRWNLSNASSRNFVNVIEPGYYHTYQASAANERGIVLRGEWSAVLAPSGIEAQYGAAGAWVPAVVDPNGTFVVDFGDIAYGSQETITVRFADNHLIRASAGYVGVGLVFLFMGQSNFVSPHTFAQVYTHPTLKAAVFDYALLFRECVDPASARPGVGEGSLMPNMATDVMAAYNVPFAGLSAAEGGSDAEDNWEPGDRLHEDMINLISRAHTKGIRAGLYFQGEADMVEDLLDPDALLRVYDWNRQSIITRFPFDAPLVRRDTFTDDDGTPLDQHVEEIAAEPWTQRAGQIVIDGDRTHAPAATQAAPCFATQYLGRAHHRQRLTFTANFSSPFSPGIVTRYDPTTGDFYVVTLRREVNVFQVRKFTNATQTYQSIANVDVIPLVDGQEYTLEVDTVGAYITATIEDRVVTKNILVGPTDDALYGGIWFNNAIAAAGSYELSGQNDAFGVIMGQTGDYWPDARATRPRTDAVRYSQMRAWDEVPGIYPGPVFYDVEHPQDQAHFRSPTEAQIFWKRWSHYYMGYLAGADMHSLRGPRFISATLVDSTHVDIALNARNAMSIGASPLIGWRVENDGNVIAVTDVVHLGGNVLRITTDAPLDGTVRTVSFASYRDGLGATIRDTTDLGLAGALNGQPMEPFYYQAVA